MNDLTARVAVFHAPGQPLELRQVAAPLPQADELLVEVTCCTLCGSDLHTYLGHRSSPRPVVLGHEILGRVVHAGERFPGAFRPGERITWSLCSSCGECFYCREGIPQKCVRLFKYGHERLEEAPLSGGLATHCLLRPGTAVFRVPDGLRDEEACPSNCATATVMAALRAAAGVRNRCVLIIGAGMLGLTATAAARVSGARDVVVVDSQPLRVRLAERFGATLAVHSGDASEPLAGIVAQATSGRGADVVFEFSGAPSAVRAGIDLCRVGGSVILVGSVFPSDPLAIEPQQVVRRLLTLRGVYNYAPEDLAAGLEFLASHRNTYGFADLVQTSLPLEQADQAFRQAVAERPVRIAVRP